MDNQQRLISDHFQLNGNSLNVPELVWTILEVYHEFEDDRREKFRKLREDEELELEVKELENVSTETFTGFQGSLVSNFNEVIDYPVYLYYREPFMKMKYGFFLKLDQYFKPPSYTGNLNELIPGLEMYFHRDEFVFSFLGCSSCRLNYIDNDGDRYIQMGKSNFTTLATYAFLALSTGRMESLYDALIEFISDILPYDLGDVELAGYEDVVERCEKIISHDHPLTMKRHILLAGPPGCGKSMIIKQLARNHPEYIGCNLTKTNNWLQWINMLSKILAKCSKKVLLVMDEIDELGLTRERDRESVYELLRLMDGTENTNNLILVASTNRLKDLDPALLRPGRFGPVIDVGYPNKIAKKLILDYYANRYQSKLDSDLIVNSIEGAISGADIRIAVEDCIVQNKEITTNNVIKNIKNLTAKIENNGNGCVI
jgi:hypothetical protein